MAAADAVGYGAGCSSCRCSRCCWCIMITLSFCCCCLPACPTILVPCSPSQTMGHAFSLTHSTAVIWSTDSVHVYARRDRENSHLNAWFFRLFSLACFSCCPASSCAHTHKYSHTCSLSVLIWRIRKSFVSSLGRRSKENSSSLSLTPLIIRLLSLHFFSLALPSSPLT